MPGPVIPNPTPDWLKPENASVTDTALTKAMRMIGHLIGADNPTAQVLGLMMTDVPGGSATGGLAKAVEGLKARVIKAYHGTASQFEQFADPVAGKAVWFTKDPAEASRYSEIAARGGGQPKVLPADVQLQRDGAQRLKELSDRPFSQAVEQLKLEGYDGFTDGNAVAVFQGGQAKIRPTIQAYHGSPHDFERFSLEKIGTGEGAQAYGHGLYFAENEDVAFDYRNRLSAQMGTLAHKGEPLKTITSGKEWLNIPEAQYPEYAANDLLTQSYRSNQGRGYKADDYVNDAINSGKLIVHRTEGPEKAYWQQVVDTIESKRKDLAVPGKMYEVAIHADPEDFLDWDKPLSQQSEKVKERIKAAGIVKNPEESRYTPADLMPRGEGAFDTSRAKASQEFVQAGIPGIKYLDQGSRAAGEGSRNYVVFDDRLIDILKKYGLLLPAAGGAGQATISRRSE